MLSLRPTYINPEADNFILDRDDPIGSGDLMEDFEEALGRQGNPPLFDKGSKIRAAMERPC